MSREITVKLPESCYISFVVGNRLINMGHLKCRNGEKVLLTIRYLCWVDVNKKIITPLRRAGKNEK